HARGIVHRDVKPDNIMLVLSTDDDDLPVERVKVCDFGIAGTTEGSSNVVSGTPEFMSPEQCRGEALDGRSDIYSLGVVLYAMATGELPFTAPTPVAILNRHLNVPPKKPSAINAKIDPRLEKIILMTLAKQPGERFPSMRDLRS